MLYLVACHVMNKYIGRTQRERERELGERERKIELYEK